MKTRILFLLILIVVMLPILFAQTADVESNKPIPMVLSTPFSRWTEVGTITDAETYPGVSSRDYTTVSGLFVEDTNMVTVELPSYARKISLSFQTSANADSTTVELMGFADDKSINLAGALVDDDAVYLGKLVLTGGQQVGKHSNVYVDTIVATDGVASFSVTDSGNDRRTVVEFACKYKFIVFVATTLQASSTLYIEGRMSP